MNLQSRTQSNACARAMKALALGKYNFSCAVIGLTFNKYKTFSVLIYSYINTALSQSAFRIYKCYIIIINSACRQRGSGCLFPQSQCLPSPHTGISLGTRLMNLRVQLFQLSRIRAEKSNTSAKGCWESLKYL